MKKWALLLAIAASLAATAQAAPIRQQRRQQQTQQNLAPGARPNTPVRPAVRRAALEDSVYAFYVRQFQQDAEMTPEALSKILPFLDEFVKERFQIAARRTRALNQLRQLIAQNGAESDLARATRELDAADSDSQANHARFLSNIDPLLNPRQQAKARLLQNIADNRVRQLLEDAQNANGQRRLAAPER
jgi:hypothetical protein